MKIQHFFDKDTSTLTYVVFDEISKDAVIFDPVLDFDPPSGRIEDHSAQKLVKFIEDNNLKIHYILETHAHADHLSSSQVLKQYYPNAKIGISERIKIVQNVFGKIFNLPNFKADGSDFDFLVKDETEFKAGSITIFPIPTPGHTPACTSFLIENCVFTGDSLFMPDYGTGRCDFPNGSANDLFNSVSRLYQLPDETKVFVGHDYQPNNRELQFQTTIGESKTHNIQLKLNTTKDEYIQFRETRDKTLKAPRLLLPSLQVNISAGHLPLSEDNGVSYLKLPLKIVSNKKSPVG
jgi:glyoxylase-like metal-dependent hydrolase (beta-lactamase superfamily II)